MKKIKIAPSMLSANFSRLGEDLKMITECGADLIHLDVMDGSVVPNMSFGPNVVKDIRPFSNATFDTHLMIVNPWKYVEAFAKAGADIITVHHEACGHKLAETLNLIKSFGVKCGAVINPDTPVSVLEPIIELCDMVLLMSVFPGFGGQKFIPSVLPKIEQTAKLIQKVGKDIDLEIDGGITLENVKSCKDAGANVIVAGSTIFNAPDRAKIIKNLREI